MSKEENQCVNVGTVNNENILWRLIKIISNFVIIKQGRVRLHRDISQYSPMQKIWSCLCTLVRKERRWAKQLMSKWMKQTTQIYLCWSTVFYSTNHISGHIIQSMIIIGNQNWKRKKKERLRWSEMSKVFEIPMSDTRLLLKIEEEVVIIIIIPSLFYTFTLFLIS